MIYENGIMINFDVILKIMAYVMGLCVSFRFLAIAHSEAKKLIIIGLSLLVTSIVLEFLAMIAMAYLFIPVFAGSKYLSMCLIAWGILKIPNTDIRR